MDLWPHEQFEGRAWPIATAVSQLLEEPELWRHRRVERFEIASAEEVRRHVSVDFTVPEPLRKDLELRDGEWVVPLGWLRRRPLTGFDLRQDGSSRPLLLASEIGEITQRLLSLELDFALGASAPEDSVFVMESKTLIAAAAGYEVEVGLLDRVNEFATRYGDRVSDFASMLRTSVEGYLLLAVVPRVAGRQVVKFAYDEPVPRTDLIHRARPLFFETPGVLEAASSHLESPLPTELRASDWRLTETHSQQALSDGVSDTDHPALYVTKIEIERRLACADDPGSPGVRAPLKVERWRFHHPAWMLTALALVTVAYGGWVADVAEIAGNRSQGPVVTILLAGVALFVALLLRLDEHSLARRLLVGPRIALGLVLVDVLTTAGALAFDVPRLERAWKVSSGLLAVLFVVLLAWTALGAGAARKRRTG